MWWLSFADGGVYIMGSEASSLAHARTLAIIKGLGRASEIEGGHFISPRHAELIPEGWVGRKLLPSEGQRLREMLGYTTPR
jgi:hypothetical protein